MPNLQHNLDWWEWFDYWATGGTVVGCFLEWVPLTVWLTKSSSIPWQRIGAKAPVMVLTISVAGELLGLIQTNSLSGQIIAGLQLETATLRHAISPRRLSSEQTTDLTKLLARHSSEVVRVSSYGLDVESSLLGAQILSAAQMAQMPAQDRLRSQDALGPSIQTGISVTGTDARLVADTLELLHHFQLEATNDEPPPTFGVSMGGQGAPLPLKIFVGPKSVVQ